MNSSEPTTPPLRGRAREALSNDESILHAAHEVFSEYGWGASMSEIAARANTGVASIYRRYPSKTDLVNAIRVLSLERICELAEKCAAEARAAAPESAVEEFMRAHILSAARPLVSAFGRYVETTPEVDALAERLRAALETVIAVDRDLGLVPDHYGPADLMLMIAHLRPQLAIDRERANEMHLRQLDYMLTGLRAVAVEGRPVAGRPSSWREWLQLNSTDGGADGSEAAAGTEGTAGA